MVDFMMRLLSYTLQATRLLLWDAGQDSAPPSQDPHVRQPGPSIEAARENAFDIFNAIHSAGRQWGSSVNHNGMSVFRGTIPAGTLLSHGSTLGPEPPVGPEWLAFEIEHAEVFAMVDPNRMYRRPGKPQPDHQVRLSSEASSREEERESRQGYLHTYQAVRDLHVLYVDGSGAAKGDMGTLDMQDLVIRRLNPDDSDHGHGKPDMMLRELERAKHLCRFAADYGLDGIVRMETGFEVIYCDFMEGLQQVSALRQPEITAGPGDHGATSFMNEFEWDRAASERYDDIGGNRLKFDFSSMASAWFNRLNLSNPDPGRPDLPRLVNVSQEDLDELQKQCNKTAQGPVAGATARRGSIDWQRTVVDMVVQRFSARFLSLTRPNCGEDEFKSQVMVATNVYHDSPPGQEAASQWLDEHEYREAIETCSAYYLRPVILFRDAWTEVDELVYAAVHTVTRSACEAFFQARQLIAKSESSAAVPPSSDVTQDDPSPQLVEAVAEAKAILGQGMDKLQWTAWKKCRGCSVGDICFIAMFPFGTDEDHFHPACRNWTQLAGDGRGRTGQGYWKVRPLSEV